MRFFLLTAFVVLVTGCEPPSLAPQKPELLRGLPAGQTFHFAFDADGAPLVFNIVDRQRHIWRWEETLKGWNSIISVGDVGDISGLRNDTTGAVLMADSRWYRISNKTAVPLGGTTECQNQYWLGTRPDGSSVCSDGEKLWVLRRGAAEWQPWLTTAKRVASWQSGIMLPDGTLLNFSDIDSGGGATALSPDGVLTEVLDCKTVLLRNCRAFSGSPILASDGRVHFLVGGLDYPDYDIIALTPGSWETEKLVNFESVAPDGTVFTARVNSFALGKNDEWFVLRKEEYQDSYPQWLIGSTVRDGKGKLITKALEGSGSLHRQGDFLYYFRYSSPASVARLKL